MKTELKSIGSWGRMHYDFLYRNNRTVINVMRLKGTLNDYIMGIDKDAEDMFNLISTLYFLLHPHSLSLHYYSLKRCI